MDRDDYAETVSCLMRVAWAAAAGQLHLNTYRQNRNDDSDKNNALKSGICLTRNEISTMVINEILIQFFASTCNVCAVYRCETILCFFCKALAINFNARMVWLGMKSRAQFSTGDMPDGFYFFESWTTRADFVSISEIDTLISKRLSVENNAKPSQLETQTLPFTVLFIYNFQW